MSQRIVDQVNAKHPHLLEKNDHEADGHFLYYACQALGPDWQLLGKSGGENGYTWPNGVRTSHDAIVQVDASGKKLQQVDIIASAGNGQLASPAWGVIPPHEWRPSNMPVPLSAVPAPGGNAPVEPTDPVKPPPPAGPICPDPLVHTRQPITFLDRHEIEDEIRQLERFYEAREGLQRPAPGLSLHGEPDMTAIAAWILDVYMRERMTGKTREQAREAYRDQIRQHDEWKNKER